MTILTHGTTLEGFKAIMAGTGKAGLASPWTVSDNDGMMYFYDAVAVAAEWEDDEDEHMLAAKQSAENAELQAAIGGKDTTVIVLVCDVPADIVEDDYSCDDAAARSIPCDSFNPTWIKHIYTQDISVWDTLARLASVIDRSLFNTGVVPEKLENLARMIADSEGYEFPEIELDEVEDVTEFIKNNA